MVCLFIRHIGFIISIIYKTFDMLGNFFINNYRLSINRKMQFEDLSLNDELNKGLKGMNYNTLTRIQEKAIPQILEGKDVLGIAQTGTGKTGAFGISILQLISNNPKPIKDKSPRVVI